MKYEFNLNPRVFKINFSKVFSIKYFDFNFMRTALRTHLVNRERNSLLYMKNSRYAIHEENRVYAMHRKY